MTILNKFFCYLLPLYLLGSLSFNAQTQNFQNKVTKCYNGTTQSFNNTTGTSVGSLSFVSGVDIPSGHKVVDVIVEINWSKTDDGSCTSASGVPADVSDVGFQINGPTGGSRYLAASGITSAFAGTSSSFTGLSNVVNDKIFFRDGYPSLLPATLPNVSISDTVAPNNDALSYYKGNDPYGSWSIGAIDDAPSLGPSLCIHSYCITLITCDPTTLSAVCKTNSTKSVNNVGTYTPVFSDLDSISDVSCLVDEITFSPSNFNCSNVGSTIPVTMVIKDWLNNTSSCITNITIADSVKPVITNCFPSSFGTRYLKANGKVTFYASEANISDNCGSPVKKVRPFIGEVWSDSIVLNCVTGPQQIWVKGTDPSGNTDSCRYILNIIDTIKPTAVCQNFNAYLGSNGNVTVSALSIDGGSNDVCPPILGRWINTQFSAPPVYTCANLGDNNVTLVVSDVSGNLSTCNAVITVSNSISATNNQFVTICSGESLTVNGNNYISTGQYADTLNGAAANGCDSIVKTNLTVLPALTGLLTQTICNEESVIVNGTTYNASNPSGTEIFTNIGANGCDSTVTVNLTVLTALTGSLTQTICNEESVIVNGTTYNASNSSGTEVFTNIGANGCDSTVTVNLTVLPALTGSLTQTICNEESVIVNGTTYNASNPSGTEVFTNIGANGCDSTVTVNLTVLPALIGSLTQTICNEESVIVNGTTYNASNPSGTEVFANIGANGCDSTVTVNLTVLPALTGSLTQTICNEESVIVNGTTYNASNPSGTEVFTNIGANGCDSTVTVNLTVLPALIGSLTQTICNEESVIVNGTTYNASNPSGTEVFANIGANGCDSTVTVNLTINNATTGVDVISACGSYTWTNGVTYTTNNNIATDTVQNSIGCDSVVTLDLTITSITFSQNVSICEGESYTVETTNYTTSGTYTTVLTAANGCDSTVTTSLTVGTEINTYVERLNAVFNLTPTVGATYQWLDCDNNNASIIGENATTFTAVNPGSYAVEVSLGNCIDTSICNDLPYIVGLNANNSSLLAVYPNPVKDKLTVELNNNYINATLSLIDLKGKVVYSQTVANETKLNLATDNLKAGAYYIKLQTENKSEFIQVIKQ